jgi:hypothetical protein
MRPFARLLLLALLPTALSAQAQQGQSKEKKPKADKELVPHDPAPIYTSGHTPLQLTLRVNIKQLRRDKGQDAPWRSATVSYTDSAGKEVAVPVRLRTRGIWRLANCDFPPLRMNFTKEDAKGTIFAKLDKPKVVTHCRNTDDFEQYLLQEFQLNRVYNAVTNYSHLVRLARITYVDSADGKLFTTRYAFLSESPEDLASRVGGIVIEQQGAGPNDLHQVELAIFSFFQYLVGNTDWSIAALHNVALVAVDTTTIPIAYDFDFAGAVNTRYATPDARLPIRRVRERLYRGYCVPAPMYTAATDRFLARKDTIYALYRDDIAALLKPERVKETLSYFDEFYQTLSDPRRVKRDIIDQCLPRG